MKTAYIVGVLAVLVVLKRKKKKHTCAAQFDQPIQNGTDCTGSAWERLSGLDLFPPGMQKQGHTSNASLGRIGNLDAGNYPTSMAEIMGALR